MPLTIASCPVLRLKPKSTSEETLCVQLTGNEGSDVNCAKWTAITGRQSAPSKKKYELFLAQKTTEFGPTSTLLNENKKVKMHTEMSAKWLRCAAVLTKVIKRR